MRGLPTLVAFRRAEAQSATIRSITDRYRRRTLQHAPDRVRVVGRARAGRHPVGRAGRGHRRSPAGGTATSTCETALVVLLLAPEAYWPLRRVGAEFHAAAEGVATFEAAAELTTESTLTRRGVAGARRAARSTTCRVLRPGRDRARPRRRHPRDPVPGRDRGRRPVRLREVHAAGGARRPARADRGPVTVHGPPSRPDRRSQVASCRSGRSSCPGRVADNLRLAAPDATDEQLWAALRRVALDGRVRDLPGGLDCPVGEDGATLSAGERARLALARVLLADRPWVLLDEPTAHLDDRTERVIVETVRELGRTPRRRRRRAPARAGRSSPTGSSRSRMPRGRRCPRPCPAPPSPPASPAARRARRRPTRPGSPYRPLLGGLASASGVALTATAGWLIVQASYQPAILTLLVAIVAVRAFGTRPAGAAVRRAAAVPRRRAAAARRPPGRRCTTPSCRSRRAHSAAAAATCWRPSSTTSTRWSTASCGSGCRCVGSSLVAGDRRRRSRRSWRRPWVSWSR